MFLQFTYISQILGGFILALLIWYPFYCFYQYGTIPVLEKSYKFFGIAIVLFFLGTQVMDSNYFLTVSLSIMMVIYLLGQKYYPYIFEKNKFTKNDYISAFMFLGLHIFLGFYAFFRSTVLSHTQLEYRSDGRSFDIRVIYERIFNGPLFQDITIILGMILIFYFIVKFIRNKKILRQDYFYFSCCVVSLVWMILLSSIVYTRLSHSFWLLWVAQFSILLKLYKKGNVAVQLILPILLLGLVIDVFKKEREFLHHTPLEYFKRDQILVEYFVKAQEKGSMEVNIPIILANKIDVSDNNIWEKRTISQWMHYYGYTDRIIPIKFVNETNINQ